MKKLFTIDDFIIAFISAMAYGLSFEIPQLLDWEMWQALLLCLAIGGAVDTATKKIVFSKAVQKSSTNKALIFFVLFIIFIIFINRFICRRLFAGKLYVLDSAFNFGIFIQYGGALVSSA